VDTSRELHVYGPLGAGIFTAPALDAFPGRKGDLRPRVLGLGTVAEDTPQGTPLEEYHTADTGAVFETMPLDINNEGKVIHL